MPTRVSSIHKGTACVSETYALDRRIGESYGREPAGITIVERRGLGFVQVMAARGKAGAVAQALGLGSVRAGHAATMADGATALPLAPGQWLVIGKDIGVDEITRCLSHRGQAIGYASDQSHGRTVLRLSGTNVRSVMEKGCRLDLHPRIAGASFCAQTVIAQIGVLLHQVDDGPTFDLILYPGLAESLLDWLVDASLEYGYRLVAA